MSHFVGTLIVQKVNASEWSVYKEFAFLYDGKSMPVQDVIKVPKGYKTDFASVPRFLWWLFPPDGIYSQAAVTHDFLYQKRKDLTWTGKKYTREECDNIFLEAMKVLGCSWATRNIMYRAVRLCGWSH